MNKRQKIKKYKTLYLIEHQKRKELEEQLEKANKAASELGWMAMILLLLYKSISSSDGDGNEKVNQSINRCEHAILQDDGNGGFKTICTNHGHKGA